jgi:hypothetical protein
MYLWLIVNLLVNIRITTTRVHRAEIVSVITIIFFLLYLSINFPIKILTRALGAKIKNINRDTDITDLVCI